MNELDRKCGVKFIEECLKVDIFATKAAFSRALL